MKIHEYQAKDLLVSYGVPCPRGVLVNSPEEAFEASKSFGGPCVVKAQVHCGGRGKAGGVRLVDSPLAAKEAASSMLGMRLVTKQTGPEGKTVHKLYVTETVHIEKEYYFALTNDPSNACISAIASGEGGTEIEEISAVHPEKIVKERIDVFEGAKAYTARYIASKIGIPDPLVKEFASFFSSVFRLYTERDCSLVEINPLVLTSEGHLCALDAKITFDDNALPRRPENVLLRDPLEEDPKEAQAEQYGINYVALNGSIGCMVNGAGLAMATMDIIKSYGGSPANFLDVGGSANAEKVASAFRILLSDRNVRAILVNIFGGIMKCDIIASGIVEAAKTIEIKVPVVVRLEGTNVDQGKKILNDSGLRLIAAKDMAQAAKICVELAKEGEA